MGCRGETFNVLTFIVYLSFENCTKLVKTADLQAHNASHREALCACRSAVFTTFVRRALYDVAGLCFPKKLSHLKLGDTRFLATRQRRYGSVNDKYIIIIMPAVQIVFNFPMLI